MICFLRDDESSFDKTLAPDQLAKPVRETVTIAGEFHEPPPYDEMLAALSESLFPNISSNVRRIIFTNMVPPSACHIMCRMTAAERFDQLTELIRSSAQTAGRTIQNAYLDIRCGSFVAIFEIA